MHNYKELSVWQKSRVLVKELYELVTNVSSKEHYGIIAQIKRAVISIPSNIAEGVGRNSKKDFSRFLDISLGSAFEVETQMILILDLDLISKLEFDRMNDKILEVQRMLFGLKNSLKK